MEKTWEKSGKPRGGRRGTFIGLCVVCPQNEYHHPQFDFDFSKNYLIFKFKSTSEPLSSLTALELQFSYVVSEFLLVIGKRTKSSHSELPTRPSDSTFFQSI